MAQNRSKSSAVEADHERLLAAIDTARENSYGTDEQSEIGSKRAESIDAYLGRNTMPAPPGRSQVIDRSVYETVHTLLPSLTKIFAGSSDEVCKAVPIGPDDEQAAEQTTSVLSHVVTEKNQWEQVVTDWLHDAMLLGNGYCMAYWDESKRMVREVYEGQSDDQVAALLQDKAITVVQHSQAVDEQATADQQQAYQQALGQYQQAMAQWQQIAQQAQQAGKPPPPQPQPPQPPQPVLKHDLVIERVENDGKVCIKTLPPEHCYVSVDTPDWTLLEAPYFEFRQERSLGELRAMGFDVADDISDDDEARDSEEDFARDRYSEDRYADDNGKGATRRVWTRMIWVRADLEDEGIDRLWYVIAVGRTILYAEPCGRIPVASMTCQPLPHRHPGMSVAETVLDIQSVKTAVTRGALDSLYLANAGRHAISSRVNVEDFLDARPGGVVRMLDDSLPAEGHIMPLQHPFILGDAIGSLEYFDQVRQNRSGASRYFSGTDANAINKTASGTIALQNMAAMRVEHMARMMAPAVEHLFSIVLEIISKHQNKPLALKLKGKWTLVDPQAWRTKRDIRISVGVGAGNKESMQQSLMQTFNAQMAVLPLGVAKPDNIHETLTEISKLAGYANPARFWTDPSQSPPIPQPPMPEQIKAQSDQQIEQMRIQAEQQKFGAEQQLEQMRMQQQAQLDAQREEMQARQKTLEQQLKAELEREKAQYAAAQEQARLEFERWKAELDAAVKLQIAGMGDATQRDLATPDNSIQSGIHAVIQSMQALAEQMNAPAEIVRDPATGKAIGVRKGNTERKIQRGPDGRAIGLQ
jgi:hypothetical protein